jgi:hypothetical protein
MAIVEKSLKKLFGYFGVAHGVFQVKVSKFFFSYMVFFSFLQILVLREITNFFMDLHVQITIEKIKLNK